MASHAVPCAPPFRGGAPAYATASAPAAPPRFGLRAYLAAGAMLLLVLVLVQLQARYRTETYKDLDLREIRVLDLQGNAMFSEGLLGWAVIPEQTPVYYTRFPGEAMLRPIPDAIADFFITPIPRALWRSKPVDPVWEWYNAIYNNTSEGREGTTIAQGLVGHWYFRYGLWGVLEGGLLVGWLLGVGERSLRHARGRPIAVLFSLAFVVWLFRNFRAYSYIDLHPLIVGAFALTLLVLLERVVLRRRGVR